MSILRPYQIDAIDRMRTMMRTHKRSVLVLPTGAGKTVTGAEVVRRVTAAGHPVLWLAHRAELVDQAAATLARLGLVVGCVSASAVTPPNPFAPVQVATVQTLLARNARPRASMIVFDEAHHAVADEFGSVVRDYPEALVMGLTATPERSDGRGLGEMFGGLVVGTTVKKLTAEGHLVPCEVMRPARYLQSGEIAQSPVAAYQQHAGDRQTVVFARGVDLAAEYTEQFRAAGVEARCITGEMPWAERSMYLDAFRRGAIRVLVNVFVLTEGWDAPETSCVILARGCSTAGTYLQMVGRALRLAPGKTDALLVDLRGVSHEFGRPDDDRLFSLEGRGIRRADDTVYCPVCGAMRVPGEGCDACGWIPTGEPMKGDTVTGDPLVKYAKKRAEGDDDRARTLARWLAVAHAKGYKPGWVYAKFRAVYGTAPSPEVVAAARSVGAA